MTKRSPFCREDGFTLVEIIITLAIMAVTLPVLLQVFSSVARNQALMDNRMTALYLLKFQMAEIEMNGFPEVGPNSGEFGENSAFQWQSTVTDMESEVIEGLRKVELTISWQHLEKVRSISMFTYMADRQIQ